MQESRTFRNNEGTIIAWNPITLLCTPKADDLLKMQEILENEEQKELLAQRDEMATRVREEGQRERLRRRAAPPMKECKKALEMDPGEYVVTRYAETTFRNAPRIVLFISPMGEDGQQKTDEEIPIWGVLLQEEIERIGPLGLVDRHLYCRLGREKTTKTKKKCRIAQLFVAEKN